MAFGSLGAVSYDVVAKDETAAGLGSASDRFRKMGTIAGAAMTGIGAAMTVMTDKARQMNAPLEAMAIQLGVNSKELREMAIETGNVTFPLDQVISSMDLLTRAGMRNVDEIAATATAFDVLGDATGASASEITTIMIPAFNAFKLELKDAGDYTDLFTHLQRNTTVEMADFSTMLKRIAPDIGTLGISLEQAVAVMEALADKGIQGTSATLEFRTAISSADGDLNLFFESLGLTAAEVATYTAKVKDSGGMTDEFADAMNTQYGFMDKLKYSVSALTLKYGAMLQPIEALGPIMMALGPILIVVSNIHWGKVIPAVILHTKALGGLIVSLVTSGGALSAHAIGLKLTTAAQWLMNTSLYACPLVWIVGAIVGVVAVLVILEKKFGIVTAAINLLSSGINAIIGFFGGVVDAIRGVVVDTDALAEADGRLIKANEDLRESEERVDEAEEKAADSAKDLAEASAELADAQLKVADAAREVDVLTEAYEDLKSAMDAVADETENLDDLDRNLRSANLDLADAQDKYTEAMGDSEATSRDRQRAALRIETIQDRIEGIMKKQIETTEALTEAEGIAAETKKKYGDKSLADVKANLDANIAANEDAYIKIEALEIKKEEARIAHEYNEEDVERELLVYGSFLNKIEEIAEEKAKIEEGEVIATESAMGKIKAAIEKGMGGALDYVTGLYGSFVSAGANIINGIVDGIKSVAGRIGSAVSGAFKEAEDYKPSSDAKKGAFSDLTKSGRSVVETFAKGIESGSGNIGSSFSAGIAPMAPAAASASASSGGDTYGGDTISIGNVSLSKDYDFPALMKDIEAYQSQKRVQRGIRTI